MARDTTAELSSERDILYAVNAPAGRRFTDRVRDQRPLFLCVIASTDTAAIPGVSAAGASPDLIPYTAPADAEILAYGRPRSIAGVPSNPLGPPGPSLITRAALQLGGLPHLIVDAGCRIRTLAPCVVLGRRPGRLITEGQAVSNAASLFAAGRRLGRRVGAAYPYLVIGESVPGGTTTALALLLGLGYPADGRVSSSLAGNNHELKSRLAHAALARLEPRCHPLEVAATLGDPMQPSVAGIALGAAELGRPVLLAGGTQMIAVAALLASLAARPDAPGLTRSDLASRIAVATTRWVIEDQTADACGLMREVAGWPLLGAALSFASSRHPALRRYEEYLVKEGVGAGGAVVAAGLARGVATGQILARVEQLYEEFGSA